MGSDPIIFLPGGLATIETSFGDLVAELGRDRRVVTWEPAGHGRTPDRDGPFTYAGFAEDAARFIGGLGVGAVDIVGWSDGGVLALLIARDHPELVRRLAVSGASIRAEGFREDILQWIRLSDARRFARTYPSVFREAYEKLSPDGPSHWTIVAGKVREMWMTPMVMPREDLARIAAPALVIAGDRDIITLEHTLEIQRGLSGAQLCIVPDAEHATFLHDEVLAPILRRFLDAPSPPKNGV